MDGGQSLRSGNKPRGDSHPTDSDCFLAVNFVMPPGKSHTEQTSDQKARIKRHFTLLTKEKIGMNTRICLMSHAFVDLSTQCVMYLT